MITIEPNELCISEESDPPVIFTKSDPLFGNALASIFFHLLESINNLGYTKQNFFKSG